MRQGSVAAAAASANQAPWVESSVLPSGSRESLSRAKKRAGPRASS